jgi:hypothetical protein
MQCAVSGSTVPPPTVYSTEKAGMDVANVRRMNMRSIYLPTRRVLLVNGRAMCEEGRGGGEATLGIQA